MRYKPVSPLKQISSIIFYVHYRNQYGPSVYFESIFKTSGILFSFESDSLSGPRCRNSRSVSLSALGEFKNRIILETSQISLQNDSGCKVDLKFSQKGSVSGAKPRSIKRTAMPFKIPSFDLNSYLRFIRNSTPPISLPFPLYFIL